MSTFTTILLIVILVLIASDVFFLWKIFKAIGKKKKSLPDEKYFELKYNINLLKAVSAILIFLLGFLGFTTYKDITSIVESDFEEKFSIQDDKIKTLDSIVKNYEDIVESLKSEEGKSIENLDDIRREFGVINKKVTQTQVGLKYTPQIFIIRGIPATNENKGQVVYFKNLKTIDGKSLPKFKNPPIINIQGLNVVSVIDEVTSDYFKLLHTIESEGKRELDLWLIYYD
jgi:heme/copper-type cytochrome/quinol oxidase subunit 2